MKFKKFLNKVLACTVVLTLLASGAVTPIPAHATNCSDISNHWAEKYIQSAISKGFANGYADGTFKPNKEVTRAEFASMLNKALGNTSTATISFNDVAASSWYYSDISKAVAAAYVSGYKDNSFRPNTSITREEAAVIISNIVPDNGSTGDVKGFGDYQSISNWALKALQKSIAKGYIGAYEDGNIHPKDCLTRAQVAKIICDITDKESIVSSTTEIKSSDTILSGKIYSNGVTIHKDLGEGNATIDNCIVMGELAIQGGGNNSVIINNSRIANCSVAKTNSSVRVVSKGETSILNTNVSNQAKLESANLTSGDTGLGFCKVKTNGSSNLSLVGVFPSVEVAGSNSEVKLESGNITTLDVGSNSRNSKITVENNGTIMTTNVNSPVSFIGNGMVQNMNANADGITYEKKPDQVNIGSKVTIKPSEIRDITFDPFDGEKNVPINKKITITFSEPMTKYDGKEILNSDLNNLIKLTKDSKSGTNVPFSAEINSIKKVITITPTQSLTADVNYYITIDKDVFKTQSGKGNDAQSICFTVQSGNANNVSFFPASGATGVKTKELTITFDSAIKAYSGEGITPNYLKNNIVFKKDSANGSNVNFTATINRNANCITIVPESKLSNWQKYYLGFGNNVFASNSNTSLIPGQSVTWSTGDTTTPTISLTPRDGATGVATVAVVGATFSERVFDSSGAIPNQSYISTMVRLKDNTLGYYVSCTKHFVDESQSRIYIDLPDGLTVGHNYTFTVDGMYFKNEDGNYATAASTTFTVSGSLDISEINAAISRANSAKANVVESVNGEDVANTIYWVTSAQMNTLNNAITTATSAIKNVRTTEEARTVVSSLDSATTAFERSKKLGLKDTEVVEPNPTEPKTVDTSPLDQSIAFVELVKKNVVISKDGTDVLPTQQWVTLEMMNALNEVLAKATKAKTTVKTDDEAIKVATEQNWQIARYFELEKKYGTKENTNNNQLASAINAATSLKNLTQISENGQNIPTDEYWVPSDVMDKFVYKDTYNAQKVLKNTSATQADIDNAESAIKAATEDFAKKRQLGTKAD